MTLIEAYQKEFASFLTKNVDKVTPKSLYDPMYYILNLGGKRIRPILVMLSCDIFGGDYKKSMYAALAVEIFHNFSLIHDDIMDKAPLRRNQPTVHTKWNVNTAILSGDAMQILAYQYFEKYDAHIFKDLARIFSKTALEVCEGQQYDLDFETQQEVSINQYLKMIEYKTAVLLGGALQMGAVVAETSEENKNIIYEFGINLGLAFQLQDDYLDTFGDEKTFGKKIGGDILENKKTMLYLKALEMATPTQKQELLHWYNQTDEKIEKIKRVSAIFSETKADEFLLKEVEKYTLQAFSYLEKLTIPKEKKEVLREFGYDLMRRKV